MFSTALQEGVGLRMISTNQRLKVLEDHLIMWYAKDISDWWTEFLEILSSRRNTDLPGGTLPMKK
jgi:hypothetical protein